jgi:hypothetical protein
VVFWEAFLPPGPTSLLPVPAPCHELVFTQRSCTMFKTPRMSSRVRPPARSGLRAKFTYRRLPDWPIARPATPAGFRGPGVRFLPAFPLAALSTGLSAAPRSVSICPVPLLRAMLHHQIGRRVPGLLSNVLAHVTTPNWLIARCWHMKDRGAGMPRANQQRACINLAPLQAKNQRADMRFGVNFVPICSASKGKPRAARRAATQHISHQNKHLRPLPLPRPPSAPCFEPCGIFTPPANTTICKY